MFKKVIVYMVVFISVLSFSGQIQAETDPKLKAMGLMALYGTVGGVLLGVASLPFGTSGRAVAQGASLGLYAGLIFGSFIAISHTYETKWKKPGDDYYPDAPESPYEQDYEEEGEGSADDGLEPPQRWNPKRLRQWNQQGFIQDQYSSKLLAHERLAQTTLFYFNFLNYSF